MIKKTCRRVLHTFLNSHERKKSFSRIKHNHPKENIIVKLDEGMRLRKRVINQVLYVCYLS
jgi:hypothetical protein